MNRRYKLFILASLLICFGCQPKEPHQKNLFTCQDYKLDVPIESVDAETNGKKSGDTHFSSYSTDAENSYSYSLFESPEKAIEGLNRVEKNSLRVLRKGELKDNNGNKVGEKIIISTWKDYQLYWTKGAMYHSVISESLSDIEEIEKACNL